MGRVDGKVAFITGAARGQGRAHAIRLAEEGADIIAIDVCEDQPDVPYPGATEVDLEQTVKAVEALDRRIVATKADVRDFDALKAAVDNGVDQLGRLDIVVANAGIQSNPHRGEEISEEGWTDMIDVNLSGVWRTCKAAIPHIRAGGRGGSIVMTSSTGGLKAFGNVGHYVAAKHGVVGLARTFAVELAPEWIRVNTVHPTAVPTDLLLNDAYFRLFRPDLENPGRDDMIPPAQALNALPIPWVEPIDIANAVLWLASDEARYVTGIALPVDAGLLAK
ncbi:mycofactocin-coupled SDR family oxidoreductase [Rhodococcus opacus]|uniref:mycofactocin-coupled SDR family oxidoreductase n=1 Tax=Rhodococcus opacus TaxID=37919 RepID=UPI00146A88D3|nr:mycofactocin-coupled SDR family oxidoreductase [Rhodococcus opacus]MDV7088940.1 mycofactocin-coupled SDR family oxidoreductase [Rhodococcus opacus]WKN60229.1 mycofactocin-coupled SDR family oxidoreductase [Rhodococcus opacus]